MKLPAHILIIRLSALGDVAMTIPVLRVFAHTYPQVKITVLSRPFFKPIFEDIPNCSFLEADLYGRHKGLGLFLLAKEARSLGIDAVADLHSVIRSKIITTYLNIFYGIGTSSIDKGRKEKKALISAHGGTIHLLKTTHQRYADVFSNLGYPIKLRDRIHRTRKPLNPRLHSLIEPLQKKVIGIAPFAAYEGKEYPFKLLEEVISRLDALGDCHIFMFGGGKNEIEILSAIEKVFPSVTNIAGQLTLEDELALISNLDVMLSMDSGNGHLAAMFGVPVITLWGVTHPFAGFKPYNQPDINQLCSDREKFPLIPTSIYGNKYPVEYENAMDTISPEDVFAAILRII